jgi:hypothetical protein
MSRPNDESRKAGVKAKSKAAGWGHVDRLEVLEAG